ncbi:alpha/beta fold hydrolase [Nannocystis pusilla]|uniref:alpha/beta fold hydrolase n=1 Tax=Nannocystis pusilla TaxID=889268 RepID=UPI003B7E1B32
MAAPPGCDDPADPIEPPAGAVATPRTLVTDPSSDGPYTPCDDSDSFAGYPTTIYYPTGTTCPAPLDDRPVVVLLPGAGYNLSSYNYLLEHLAEHGFIAVGIDILASDPGGHEDAAEYIEGVLTDILATWPHASAMDPSRLALVGHSRGGQTSRFVADRFKGNTDDWTVRAIVGLASQGGGVPITGDLTNGYLLLVGSADPQQVPSVSYGLYDGAGSEGSLAFADPNGIYKAMKLLEGANHDNFAEINGLLTSQAHVTKGYVMAFLAAHLLGNASWYEVYIRGDAVPYGWSNVVGQVSDGFLRTVVDNSEDNSLAFPTIGGAFSYSPGCRRRSSTSGLTPTRSTRRTRCACRARRSATCSRGRSRPSTSRTTSG